MTGLDAGRLDRLVQFERASMTTDALNEPVEQWGLLASVWASATPVSDGERFAAGERAAEITMRFRTHHCAVLADLDERDRVVFDGRVYDITGVKEIGRQRGIEVTAAARAERG